MNPTTVVQAGPGFGDRAASLDDFQRSEHQHVWRYRPDLECRQCKTCKALG